MLTVAEIMTSNPLTLGPDDSLAAARKLMAENNIRHVPIVAADGSPVGVVSQRDVLAAEDSTVIPRSEEEEASEGFVALSAIMTSPAKSVDEHASLRGAALHLQKHRFGCLLVTRDDALVGIITDTDFVAVAINLMEQLEAAEPEEYSFGDDFGEEAGLGV